MNEEIIETVVEHCKHEDCVYRAYLGSRVPYCNYCYMEKQVRGCKISECNRYKQALKHQTLEWDDKTITVLWNVEEWEL